MHRGRLVLEAPAKINLTLDVLGRRGDGYHALRSVMHAIDLSDRVTLELAPGAGVRVTSNDPSLPCDLDNLAGRAAQAWLEACGRTASVTVELDKRIPWGAGLGGGSSDAAAVLLGLNRLAGHPLGAADLFDTAATLGSDVPFFLVGGTALAEGRGERLRSLAGLPPLTGVVAWKEGFHVKTCWVYKQLQNRRLTGGSGFSTMLLTVVRERDWTRLASALGNDLEPTVLERHPELADTAERLLRAGASTALLAGSGGAMIGLFPGGASDAAHAVELLGASGLRATVFRSAANTAAARQR